MDNSVPLTMTAFDRLLQNWPRINSNPLTLQRQMNRKKKTNNRKLERQNRRRGQRPLYRS